MLKMMMPLKRYTQFNGRASRSEFWWFQVFIVIVSIPLYVLGFVAGYTGSQSLALASTGLGLVVALILTLPSLAVTMRRLHDTDRSGWWLLLGFIPIVSLVLVVFMLLPGTPGGNRFGVSAPRD